MNEFPKFFVSIDTRYESLYYKIESPCCVFEIIEGKYMRIGARRAFAYLQNPEFFKEIPIAEAALLV